MKTITPQHDLQEGDILCSTWGYDQTNVDFYRVEEIRGKKKVMLSHLRNKTVANHTTTVEVVPCEDSVNELKHMDPLLKQKWQMARMVLTRPDSKNFIKITNYQTAVKWHGQPMRETAWGYGH